MLVLHSAVLHKSAQPTAFYGHTWKDNDEFKAPRWNLFYSHRGSNFERFFGGHGGRDVEAHLRRS